MSDVRVTYSDLMKAFNAFEHASIEYGECLVYECATLAEMDVAADNLCKSKSAFLSLLREVFYRV